MWNDCVTLHFALTPHSPEIRRLTNPLTRPNPTQPNLTRRPYKYTNHLRELQHSSLFLFGCGYELNQKLLSRLFHWNDFRWNVRGQLTVWSSLIVFSFHFRAHYYQININSIQDKKWRFQICWEQSGVHYMCGTIIQGSHSRWLKLFGANFNQEAFRKNRKDQTRRHRILAKQFRWNDSKAADQVGLIRLRRLQNRIIF